MGASTGLFGGSKKSWKLILCCGILLSNLPFALLLGIKVNGPDSGLDGDFEQFTCVLEGDDVDSKSGLEWKYQLSNAEMKPVTDSDMLTALEFRTNSSGKLMVSSFIRLRSDVNGISCQNSAQVSDTKAIQVGDLKPVLIRDDICAKAAEKPLTIMQTTKMNYIQPYRMARYVDGESVSLSYPSELVQFACVTSKIGESPVWSLKKEEASKMKFAAWAQNEMGDPNCKRQFISIYEVQGQPGETVKFSVKCTSGSSSAAPVDINFKIADIPTRGQVDFNSTENCINEVVEQFYGKELTGVGVASSFVIVLMMVGMAVMKKQLNNQQNSNNGNQGQGNNTDQSGSNNGGNNPNNGNQQNPGTSSPSSGTTMTA